MYKGILLKISFFEVKGFATIYETKSGLGCNKLACGLEQGGEV